MKKEVNILVYQKKHDLLEQILFGYVDEYTEDPVLVGQMFRLLELML